MVFRNAAITDRSLFITTMQMLFETESHPLQPPKREFASGFAESLIKVPLTNPAAARLAKPSMPTGALLTLPIPSPDLVTISVYVIACSERVGSGWLGLVATIPELVPESLMLARWEPTSTGFVIGSALGSDGDCDI